MPAIVPARSWRWAGLLALVLAGPEGARAEEPAAFSARHAEQGVEAVLELRPVADGPLLAGQPARFRLNLTTAEGAAARGLKPAAWAERSGGRALSCQERVRGLIEARLGRKAEVDFNAWHLAYLGSNGAVYVLDPVGGTSRSRVLAAVNLGGRPGGWAEDRAGSRLYVSLPEQGEVAEIDTARWALRQRIEVGGRPGRLALHPDAQQLWIGQEGGEGATEEVAVLERGSAQVSSRHAAGPGPHALAALGGGRALATSPAGATILGDASAKKLDGLGGGFSDAAHSALADAALLLDAAEGRVLAVAPDGRVTGHWTVAPGAAGLFPDPGGRLLFVPEPGEGRVTVIDLARGAVAHRVPVGGTPLHVGFSGTQAYVQSGAGASVSLIALGSLGEAGTPAVTTIAAGEAGLEPGEALGPMITPAPGQEAMLIAAPGEQAIHVYMEGMAAPSGLLRAPRGRPLAITAVDHGLRETEPGRYETQAVFPGAGRYVVPVMLQGTGFLHCFEVEIGGTEAVPMSRRLSLELLDPDGRTLPAGAPSALRLRLRGPEDLQAWRQAGDLRARVVQFVGHWQVSLPLKPLGDGLYEVEGITPPRAGPVQVYVESPSLGLEPGTLPHILLRAQSP
ncbi:hypothetical protein J8J14_07135 [Roseomonas sp. SSH11]|uniref:YVTN family beta-propeller protein n=1 Tax=Pararoseomonas baculiformis TaxID=2820812 RepID=A0ABS4AC18_9PROT|nr:hypothetical protein [Pararoseomonas baculiformis]MBP0444553.1 hypothetical protein [Pararoseomonas baculiformis]